MLPPHPPWNYSPALNNFISYSKAVAYPVVGSEVRERVTSSLSLRDEEARGLPGESVRHLAGSLPEQ